MTEATRRPRPRTATEVSELYPELEVGTRVTVFNRHNRGVWYQGTIVAHVRNGYVRVSHETYQTTCDHFPNDVHPLPYVHKHPLRTA